MLFAPLLLENVISPSSGDREHSFERGLKGEKKRECIGALGEHNTCRLSPIDKATKLVVAPRGQVPPYVVTVF